MAIIRQLLLCHTKDKRHLINYKPCFIHIVNINYLMDWIACKINFALLIFHTFTKTMKNSPPPWVCIMYKNAVPPTYMHQIIFTYEGREHTYPLDASSIDVFWLLRSGIPIIYQSSPPTLNKIWYTRNRSSAIRFILRIP